VPEEEEGAGAAERAEGLVGYDELQAIREARRLTRAIECELPSADGWDIQVRAFDPIFIHLY
jgi:hypothetical protein